MNNIHLDTKKEARSPTEGIKNSADTLVSSPSSSVKRALQAEAPPHPSDDGPHFEPPLDGKDRRIREEDMRDEGRDQRQVMRRGVFFWLCLRILFRGAHGHRPRRDKAKR